MKQAVTSVIGAVLFVSVPAFAQAPFYQGKTITVIATTAPGGTGDMRVKALVPTLRKHIPGNPTLVIEYMDGGGGRKGANFLFRNAKPDGLTVGAMSGAVIGLQIMRESGVLYDIDKFSYLGSPESVNHYTIYTRKELGLSNLDKLRAATGIRIGAQSVGHVSYIAGRLFAYFFGLKDPKFIAGYTSPEVDAALLRGELDARANNAASVLRRNPDWLDKGLMNFHAILEVPKGTGHPKLAIFQKLRASPRPRMKEGSSLCGGCLGLSARLTSYRREPPRTASTFFRTLSEKHSRIRSFTAIFSNWSARTPSR